MADAAAIVVEDLARPRLPWWFRAANQAVRPLQRRIGDFDPDRLLEDAQRRTGLRDFGDERFLVPFRALVGSFDRESNLTPVGRAMSRRMVLLLLEQRLRLQDVWTRHPEIRDLDVRSPIVISGLPRTGTTHFHNVLGADPNLRSLPYWEGLEPVGDGPEGRPPEGRDDPRIKRTAQALTFMNRVMPLFPAMHEMIDDGPTEEIQLLAFDFSSMLFEAGWEVPSYAAWYSVTDQAPAYQYLRRVLQILQWLRGGDRWVLKSPQHLEQLPALFAAFPDAVVVQTHRDPVAVSASLGTMLTYARRTQHRPVDPRELSDRWCARVEAMLRANVRDRDAMPRARVLDVRFTEFMADQAATVEAVYRFADQPWDADAQGHIADFLAANPRGKHGRLQYRLDDLGIDVDELRARFAFYRDRFDIGDEEIR